MFHLWNEWLASIRNNDPQHSLYGTEDRIIIDPGSRVWKVGFSGEGKPRHVSVVRQGSQAILWGSTWKYTTEE